MLEVIQTYSKEIFSLGSVFVAFVLNRLFRLRPNLIYSVRHSTNYIVDEPLKDADGKVVFDKQIVRTASIVSENTGLSAAKGVEFTFNWKPPIYNVWPGRAFSVEETGMGRWSIKLDTLAPGETFGIEILSINQELPLLSAVRSEDATGKLIVMEPQRQFSAAFNLFIGTMLIVGLVATVYLATLLVQWLAR